jgi:hypothetical protein
VSLQKCGYGMEFIVRDKVVECTKYDLIEPTPLIYKTAWTLYKNKDGEIRFKHPIDPMDSSCG